MNRSTWIVLSWFLLLLSHLGQSVVVARKVAENSTLPEGDDRLYFSTVIRNAKIIEETIDDETYLANVTVQFKTGPNPPKSEYFFKCVPDSIADGCEAIAPNSTVTGPLPIVLGEVTATIVNLDFSPGTFYTCHVGANVGKITSCEDVSSGSGPEGKYFYLAPNGVTVLCPEAEVGRTGYINGIKYTKVDEQTLRSMANNILLWNRLPFVCTSGITDMSYLLTTTPNPVSRVANAPFQKFNENIASWDTSSVVSMSFMFGNANSFNSPVDWWDVSNVRRMDGMFCLAMAFNQSLSSWNTGNVVTFKEMFLGASKFNSDIGNWDTSKAEDMSYMFDHASNFNQNIGNWNTSNVRNMAYMFNYAFRFNQNLGRWDTTQVADMNHMFAAATVFNQNLNSWNTEKVENFNAMFAYTDTFNGAIDQWKTNNAKSTIQMFNFAAAFNRDIGSWNVSKVTTMAWMFYGASVFNKNIGGWNTGNVVSMTGMFMSTSFNQDLTRWDASKVTSCQGFADNGALNVTNYPRLNCVLGYCATGRTYQKHSPTIVYAQMESGAASSITAQKVDLQNYCSPF